MMYPSMLSHYTINYNDHNQGSSPNNTFHSYSASSTPSRSKRRNSDYEDNFKKVKQGSLSSSSPIPREKLTLENINLNEYAKFHHPEGGFIQFTPIGNIRTWMGDNNVVHKSIEKNSSFDLNNLSHGIDGYKLYLGESNDAPAVQIDNSPSNETENYMRNGYNGSGTSGGDVTANTSYYDDGGSSASRLQYYFDDDEFESDEDMN
ncbi:hypothetical protein OGAPHI_005557 [Ogataea philodendri]|uniref:Uncharacterized protein n=1 Tax=Ogataea philodendri TaxID=1378263 RepID=A0A9P8NZY3_9ASCO|nr:uncharacterized protein OGAPHI_005557 [Ogataea philodendri]KAH3662307.1 hypothetical protein OGAPHI_005557 [Ogataea philodendri]